MIDQFLYGRRDSDPRTTYGSKQSVGYQLALVTEGLEDMAIQAPLTKLCSYDVDYKDDVKDAYGRGLPVITKRKPAQAESLVVIQQNVTIPQRPPQSRTATAPLDAESECLYAARPFKLSHGYVMDMGRHREDVHNPDRWFGQDYVDFNFNIKQVSFQPMAELPQKAAPLWSLQTMLEKNNLTLKQFITAVRATFDAQNHNALVILEVDYSKPDAMETGSQLLRWIYHLLPLAMRREVGFTTCYSKAVGGGDFSLALIPSTAVTEQRGGNSIAIRPGMGNLGFGYLIGHGMVQHATSSKYADFDGSGSEFDSWLGQIICVIAEKPAAQQLRWLEQLLQIYTEMDEDISKLPQSEQCRVEYYDALCWEYTTQHQKEDRTDRKTKPGDVKRLLSIRSPEKLIPSLPDILQQAQAAAKEGYSDEWVEVLCRIQQLPVPTEYHAEAEQTLQAYLLLAVDCAPQGGLSAALGQYCIRRQELGATEQQINGLLEAALFPDVMIPREVLALAGSDVSPERNQTRRCTWLAEQTRNEPTIVDLMERVREILARCRGFAEANCDCMIALLGPVLEGQVNALCTGIKQPTLFKTLSVVTKTANENKEKWAQLQKFMDYVYKLAVVRCVECTSGQELNLIAELEQGVALFKSYASRNKVWAKLMHAQLTALTQQMQNKNYLPENDPELPHRMIQLYPYAYQLNLQMPYYAALEAVVYCLLRRKSYTCIDRKWISDLANALRTSRLDVCIGTSYQMIAALDTFLERRDYSCNGWAEACRMLTIHSEPEQRALLTLIRMVNRGDFREISPELLLFYATRADASSSTPKSPSRRAQKLQQILEIHGSAAWIRQLQRYPTCEKADFVEEERKQGFGARLMSNKLVKQGLGKFGRGEEEESSFQPRPKTCDWMETDEALFTDLAYVISNRNKIARLMQQDEFFCVDFIENLMVLAPAGYVYHPQAKELATMVYEIWQELDIKNAEVNRALKTLKKQGAFKDSKG